MRILPRDRTELFFALLVFWGSAYFFHGNQGNSIARCDMIFACVEPGTPGQGTFRIDHFLPRPDKGINTCDWARNLEAGPHYHCNKAPGPQLLGILFYYLVYHAESALGFTPESHRWTRFNHWLLNLLLTVLPLALSAPFFLRLLAALGASRRSALVLGLVLYGCTLVTPYANGFWGHSTAVACLVPALYLLLRPAAPRPGAAGLLLGAAVLAEYSAAIPLLLAAGLVAARHRLAGTVRFGLGGLVPFLVHAWYHRLCFGSPLTAATFYNNTIFLEQDKVGGLFGPMQLETLWGLTFSPFRGLFWYMPILLAALPGAFLAWRRRRYALVILAGGTGLGTLAMNLTFNGWHGGACMGPRYLIIALPLLVLLMIDLPGRPGGPSRRGRLRLAAAAPFLLLGLLSWANMTVLGAVSTTGPISPEGGWSNPLANYYAMTLEGRLHPPLLAPIRLDGDWRCGPAPGAPGPGEIARLAGRPFSQASGRLDPEPGTGGWAARTLLLPQAGGRARFEAAWQGRLRLWLNGRLLADRTRREWGRELLAVELRLGVNQLTLHKGATAPGGRSDLLFFARLEEGLPVLPHDPDRPSRRRFTGVNLGQKAGLPGRWALAPFLLVQVLLVGLLWRLAAGKGSPPGG